MVRGGGIRWRRRDRQGIEAEVLAASRAQVRKALVKAGVSVPNPREIVAVLAAASGFARVVVAEKHAGPLTATRSRRVNDAFDGAGCRCGAVADGHADLARSAVASDVASFGVAHKAICVA